jgi:NAD(P)-dependent dehydrogenase (short-subunit alcohol dehydrogenase family)
MKSFRDRAVVITGAASGIGEALARRLAREQARLLLADVDTARLQAVAQSLQQAGAICLAQACDVADPAAVQALADTAQREFGATELLVNNAGVALVAPVDSLDAADARWLMDINFWGVVHGCRAFGPQLRAQPGRTVVNVSSVFAMVSMPTQSIYNASKAAVRGFSDALREEWRDAGVQVLCVHPGGIRTRIVQQARLGDISAVADSPQALRDNFDRIARTSAEDAAAAIAIAVLAGRTRLLIGADAHAGDWLHRFAPARASAWFTALARRQRERLSRGGVKP